MTTISERYIVDSPALEFDIPVDQSVTDKYRELLQGTERSLVAPMTFDDIVNRANNIDYPCALQRMTEEGHSAVFQPHLEAVVKSPQARNVADRLTVAFKREVHIAGPVGMNPQKIDEIARTKANSFIAVRAIKSLREQFEPLVQEALVREIKDRVIEGVRLLEDKEHDGNIDLLSKFRGNDVGQVWDLATTFLARAERTTDERERMRLAQAFGSVGYRDDRLIIYGQGMNRTPVDVKRLKEICLDKHVRQELSQQKRFRRPQNERIAQKYEPLYAVIESKLPEEIVEERIPMQRAHHVDTELLRSCIKGFTETSLDGAANASKIMADRMRSVKRRDLVRAAVTGVVAASAVSAVAHPAAAQAATPSIVRTGMDIPMHTGFADASEVLPNLGKAKAPAVQQDKAPLVSSIPNLQPVSTETISLLTGQRNSIDLTKVAAVIEHKTKMVRQETVANKQAFRDHVVALAKKNPDAVDGHQLAEWLEKYAEKYGSKVVTKELITSLLWQESGFNPNAKNARSGAKGMGQFMPGTAQEMGLDNPYDPQDSVKASFKYMRRMEAAIDGLHPHASVAEKQRLSLAAYNAGPGNVRKYGGIPPFSETRDYVRKITKHTSEIQTKQGEKQTVTEVTTGLTLDMPVDTTPDAVTAKQLIPINEVIKTIGARTIAATVPLILPDQAPPVSVVGQPELTTVGSDTPVQMPDGSVMVAPVSPAEADPDLPSLVIPPDGPALTDPTAGSNGVSTAEQAPTGQQPPELTPDVTIPVVPAPGTTQSPNSSAEIPSTEDGNVPNLTVPPTEDIPSDPSIPATQPPTVQTPVADPSTPTPNSEQPTEQPQGDQIIQINPEDLQSVPVAPSEDGTSDTLSPEEMTTITQEAATAAQQAEKDKQDKQLPEDISKDVEKKVASGECPAGTTTLGVYKTSGGKSVLCAIRNLPSSSEESQPSSSNYVKGANGHAIVEQDLAAQLQQMVADAAKDGITLTATSSFRTIAHQKKLWDQSGHNADLVAPPGHSMHNIGNAIDFDLKVNSARNCVMVGAVCTSPNDEVYNWLVKNSRKYGFGQYFKEAWHFDTLKGHWVKQ